MSIKDFFTRENANEGIEVPLYRPGSKEKSGEWIRIRGVDSDEFRAAELESKRAMRSILENPDIKDKDKRHREELTKLLASLVISWSFPEECVRENIIELLSNAPQIEDAINTLAANRALFFKNGSANSVNTPGPSSN